MPSFMISKLFDTLKGIARTNVEHNTPTDVYASQTTPKRSVAPSST